MIVAARVGGWVPPALAALIIIWAAMDWVSVANETHAGFETDAGHVVARVQPGSPAAEAGLAPGDEILEIDGIPVGDATALARLPRPAVGETRAYRVARVAQAAAAEAGRGEPGTAQGGIAERVVTVAFAPLPARAVARGRASTAVGLCFLVFPLLAWQRQPSRATRVLLVMGAGLSLAFIDGPRLDDASMRALVGTVTTLFALAGVAAVVHFLLLFPQPRPWLDRGLGKGLLYLPAFLLWGLLAWRILLLPPATGPLNVLTNLGMTVVIAGYLLAALFLLLRNYSRTDRAERRALALNGMLWGAVLGVLPALLAQLTAAFSPASELPGQDFWFVSLALVPLAWSRSAAREVD